MSIFKQSLAGLSSEFSFSKAGCLTKTKEISLPYYLPIAGGRIIGFIPLQGVLVLCNQPRPGFELVSLCPLFYDDNHYTAGTNVSNKTK